MPAFAANLSTLYPDLPFLDRFAAAARSGFKAVEFQFPYAFQAADIAQRLNEHRLQLVLHNLPAGDWVAGERGIACHPDRVDEFRAGVQQALTYARVLGTPRMNCLAGILPAGVSKDEAWTTLVANLRHAATALQAEGIALLVEPINTFDIPGFFIHRTDQALALLDEVDHPNLRLQYDLYHAQRMEGNLVHTLRTHLPRIGHIQLADSPDRHEPGTGEINFRFVLQELDRLGYAGHVGCEYFPADTGPGATEKGLCWMADCGLAL